MTLVEPWGRVRASVSCPAWLPSHALRRRRSRARRVRARWGLGSAPAPTAGSRFRRSAGRAFPIRPTPIPGSRTWATGRPRRKSAPTSSSSPPMPAPSGPIRPPAGSSRCPPSRPSCGLKVCGRHLARRPGGARRPGNPGRDRSRPPLQQCQRAGGRKRDHKDQVARRGGRDQGLRARTGSTPSSSATSPLTSPRCATEGREAEKVAPQASDGASLLKLIDGLKKDRIDAALRAEADKRLQAETEKRLRSPEQFKGDEAVARRLPGRAEGGAERRGPDHHSAMGQAP